MSTITRTYESWMAFLAAVDEPLTMPKRQRASQTDERSRNDWAGGTFADVRREAEASMQVAGAIATASTPITEYALAAHYDVAGGEVDVGRFLAGEPESMVEYVLAPLSRAGRVLRLQVDVSQSWKVASSAVRAAGNAVVALADGLRARGLGLEIVVTAQIDAGTPVSRHETGIVVQKPNEPFDVSRLAFAIAHPGMTRRLWFSTLEHEPWDVREQFGISLGRSYGLVSPRQWERTDAYVELTAAALADGWAQDQIARLT